ncbi:hypothetical protein FN846DRAFT_912594 [Sphaerosporella brunnea]|uniref:Uncharacterized protein n=1 Tax=Sphaerosporella brunnea TaxID=1250544 RepID=A0A5J5EH26_9PEZI|nr:hypothetical protein FN846DRAFT_912594 [Sphaerosporella brunnea]
MDQKDSAIDMSPFMGGTHHATDLQEQNHGMKTFNTILSLLDQLAREHDAEADLLHEAMTKLSLTDETFGRRETYSVRDAFLFFLNDSSATPIRIETLRRLFFSLKKRVDRCEVHTYGLDSWDEPLGQYHQDRSRRHEIEKRALANRIRMTVAFTVQTVEDTSEAMIMATCSSIGNSLGVIAATLARTNPAGYAGVQMDDEISIYGCQQ